MKDITTIFINSAAIKNSSNIITSGSRILSYIIETPPISINEGSVLKVSNLSHTGSGHGTNIYNFRVDGININNTKYISNEFPVILSTTFANDNRLYEENEITLTKQTINNIKLSFDEISSAGVITAGIPNTLFFCISLKIEDDDNNY